MPSFIDLSGQRFGRLLVGKRADALNLAVRDARNEVFWVCRCDCGKTTIVRSAKLRSGRTRSCGCLHRDTAQALGYKNATHGFSRDKHPLYRLWRSIKDRCYRPQHRKYRYWGGRGITMHKEWRDNFQSFFDYVMATIG